MSDGGYEELAVRREQEIGIVTLNAPARRNALSLTMRRELYDALADLDAEPAVRAIVLTGAGGNFCAGGDLKSMEGITPDQGRKRLGEAHQLVRQIAEMSTPIIAAVEGYAYGAGLSIAALCDVVVTVADAQWSCAFGKIGLMPDMGATWILPQRIGVGRARLLAFTGRPIDGRQAVDWGLADHLADGDAVGGAMAIGKEIAGTAPLSVAHAKRAFALPYRSLDEALDAEVDAQAALFGSADFAEGRDAFFAKRRPAFKGR